MAKRNLPNWLDAYLLYTAESESPDDFHLWCGISAIAGALRRKVYYDMGYFLIYPNMYIVLVSPAGRCKKSTAMRISRGILKSVPDLTFSADSTTRERFILDMTTAFKDGQSAVTAHSSEFASLLTSSGMDMVIFLIDIFDSPPDWQHKTKSGGVNLIKAPYLNMLAATTPDWIATAMPLDTVGVGLTSRIVFVYHDVPRIKPPRPKVNDTLKAIKELLIKDLISISTIAGEYIMDAEAEQFYDDWYMEHLKSPNESGDPRLSGYYERKPVHAIKLATIVAAAQRDECLITLKDVNDALTILGRTEKRMKSVFAHVGKNPLAHDIENIMVEILNDPEGLDVSVLLNRYKHSVRKEELEEVLETLVMMKKVTFRNGKYYSII